jgi:hypothetical protein
MRAMFWALLLAGIVIVLWILVVWFEHRRNGPPRRKDGGWPG